MNERVEGIPIIVVGRIYKSERISKAVESPWTSDRHNTYELHRLRIDVETVLAGTLPKGKVDIFFFRSTRPVGQALLGTVEDGGSWQAGQRELLFLQPDKDYLRTVCDTYAHCAIHVLSGLHKSVLGTNTWIEQRIVDVLLTRGEGVTDEAFAQAVNRSSGAAYDFDRMHTMEVLRQNAASDKPAIRDAALAALENLHQ